MKSQGTVGAIRDLVPEAEELSKLAAGQPEVFNYVEEVRASSQRLKRETRLAMSILFDSTHPVRENLGGDPDTTGRVFWPRRAEVVGGGASSCSR
jgi:hypothetical protein